MLHLLLLLGRVVLRLESVLEAPPVAATFQGAIAKVVRRRHPLGHRALVLPKGMAISSLIARRVIATIPLAAWQTTARETGSGAHGLTRLPCAAATATVVVGAVHPRRLPPSVASVAESAPLTVSVSVSVSVIAHSSAIAVAPVAQAVAPSDRRFSVTPPSALLRGPSVLLDKVSSQSPASCAYFARG